MLPNWLLNKINKKKNKQEFEQIPLYIEDYDYYPPKDKNQEKEDEKEKETNIVIIDMF
jgi:hypothetical protein